VSNSSNKSPEFFEEDGENANLLWQYVQSMAPDTVSQLSKPTSHDIVGLLGNLPSEHFGVTVTTSREHLGRLLASAMISGYFLKNAEQRMTFEKSIQASERHGSEDESIINIESVQMSSPPRKMGA
jgi:hypothetical protein